MQKAMVRPHKNGIQASSLGQVDQSLLSSMPQFLRVLRDGSQMKPFQNGE
jgi:hypothetical protein